MPCSCTSISRCHGKWWGTGSYSVLIGVRNKLPLPEVPVGRGASRPSVGRPTARGRRCRLSIECASTARYLTARGPSQSPARPPDSWFSRGFYPWYPCSARSPRRCPDAILRLYLCGESLAKPSQALRSARASSILSAPSEK